MMQDIALLYLFADSKVFPAHEDLRGSGSKNSSLLLTPCMPTRRPKLVLAYVCIVVSSIRSHARGIGVSQVVLLVVMS